ncbi:MAG: class I SAM-dependent methyltransferase [Bacteroidetes bacterium]|nr:class I SAM-dependent methyltransferase [Bacteroidota bacterium]
MGKFNSYDRIADLYDHYVTADYDINFWLEECRGAEDVLEVTAGTGRVTLPLLRAGIRLTAVDISYALLTRLKEKAAAEGLAVETLHADMRDFVLKKKFPIVIIPFHSIEEIHDGCDVTASLRGVRQHLAPGGRALITLHNPAAHHGDDSGIPRLITDQELPNGNRMIFWHARTYNAAEKTGMSYQLYEEYDVDGLLHRKRLFTPHYHLRDRAEIEQLADRAGLKVTRIWGGYKHEEYTDSSRYMIFEMKE